MKSGSNPEGGWPDDDDAASVTSYDGLGEKLKLSQDPRVGYSGPL
jgi:hypothetical protein